MFWSERTLMVHCYLREKCPIKELFLDRIFQFGLNTKIYRIIALWGYSLNWCHVFWLQFKPQELTHLVAIFMLISMISSSSEYRKNSEGAFRRCSWKEVAQKFLSIYKKTSVLEYPFNKVADLKACNSKHTPAQVFSCK